MQHELSYKNVLALGPKNSFWMGTKTQGKGKKSKRLKNVIFSEFPIKVKLLMIKHLKAIQLYNQRATRPGRGL